MTSPKFKVGDLVKYKKSYNNYGDCLAIRMPRLVMEYVRDPWNGLKDPHWYILEPAGHHWCDPEHGLELISKVDEIVRDSASLV